MKVAYVIARYRAPSVFEIRQHVHEAELIAAELLRMGYAVICPQKNTEGMDGVISEEEFLERCLRLVEVSDIGVAHRNHEQSWGGCQQEIQKFNSALKPVYFWPADIPLLREHVNLPYVYDDEPSWAPDD